MHQRGDIALTDVLLESASNGVATLMLNRPERLNALSPELYDALLTALQRVAEDAETGAVVLTGAGRAFCAGGDVKGMATRKAMTLEESYRDLRRRTEIARLLHEMPKPTIAQINGAAFGAGLSIALACDLRLAARSATFSTAFAKVGLSGDFGGSFFLNQLVGPAKARELFFTAATLDAESAADAGLVNRVVADDELGAATRALAEKLAAGPRIAFGYMKRNLNAAMGGAGLKEVLDLEGFATARARMTEDHREATQAFAEKREPLFKGR